LDSDTFIGQLADIFNSISVNTPETSSIIAIVAAGILLLASGFASASEIAFFSLSPADLSELEDGKHPSDEKIEKLLDDKERLLELLVLQLSQEARNG
jgi:CBS domain containing-hemolysin-like protein